MNSTEGALEGEIDIKKKELELVRVPGPSIKAETAASKNDDRKSIGVLASGRGSNFQAIIDAVEDGRVNYGVSILICNDPDAFVLNRASKHSIPSVIIDHRGKERESFDREMNSALVSAGCDVVVLAGFMRMLSPWFVKKWKNRVVNIHPALLPSFPGTNAHRDALEYGVKITGLTIHFVDEGMDSGPIIFQHAVRVEDDDDEDSLSMRVLEKEHHYYPIVIDSIVHKRYSIMGRKVSLDL